MSQISVASVMMHLHMTKETKPDDNMVRHMILNSLRMYRTRFKSEFGELVLCYDSKHYWRRDYFPEYKASRRTTRKKSNHDWDAIFECLNKMKKEFLVSLLIMVMLFISSCGEGVSEVAETIVDTAADLSLSGDITCYKCSIEGDGSREETEWL